MIVSKLQTCSTAVTVSKLMQILLVYDINAHEQDKSTLQSLSRRQLKHAFSNNHNYDMVY